MLQPGRIIDVEADALLFPRIELVQNSESCVVHIDARLIQLLLWPLPTTNPLAPICVSVPSLFKRCIVANLLEKIGMRLAESLFARDIVNDLEESVLVHKDAIGGQILFEVRFVVVAIFFRGIRLDALLVAGHGCCAARRGSLLDPLTRYHGSSCGPHPRGGCEHRNCG
ncbi:hypothetical protein CPB85DRAFT_1295469 [Mucidula mucida]|nr:hypothetical protein CPB85DRAFT_1295469 [Mucidula mucida]